MNSGLEVADEHFTDAEKQILRVKSYRHGLNETLQYMKSAKPSREMSLAVTNLEQSIMWLDKTLEKLSAPN